MCGICGVWEYGATEERIAPGVIERMRDEMRHRGPDDAGLLLFDENRGGLGFRRLSIIDLSKAGHQPMHGCTDKIWFVCNGEIYNHAQLREGLKERGHKFSSQTDSETIVHLYEERGLDFVHEIEGDYAIALWDGQNERLILVRDRIGVKPLYFHHKNGRFIFASEIKAILQHPAVTADVDEDSLYHYLSFLTAPAPRTLFSGIQKLAAGHLLIVSRNGSIKLERYWDALPPEKAEIRTDQEYIAEILRLLRASIKKRMMSDVPFGVFLSGGVDSSANVALMSEVMSRPVETFTVGFSDAKSNEFESARRVARQFQTNHHEVVISQREVQQFLPEMVWHQDEPIGDPVCVPLYHVSKYARESGTIVVQVGEGSDEIFCGYDYYLRSLRIYERYWQHAKRLPRFLRQTFCAIARPTLEVSGRRREAIELLRRLAADEPLFWGGAVVYDETFKPRLLSKSFRSRMKGRSSLEIVRTHLDYLEENRPNSNFLSQLTYLELKLRLPELLLMRVDKFTMATSIEARVPFLDHHLVDYAMGVPRRLKVAGHSGKHILKRALETILPGDLLYCRKRGFGAPIEQWLRGNLVAWFDEHLLTSKMRSRDFFDYKFIAHLLEEHRGGAWDWSWQLWAVLNLSLWYDRWIDRS
jgi:asparagine synthase (glutamine-hydrolysing)